MKPIDEMYWLILSFTFAINYIPQLLIYYLKINKMSIYHKNEKISDFYKMEDELGR